MQKTPLFPSLFIAAALVNTTLANSESTVPTGSLTVTELKSDRNVIPKLEWDIVHPKTIKDLIDEQNDGDIETLEEVKIEFSMLGTGITDSYGNIYPSLSKVKFDSGSWLKIFKGDGLDVVPKKVLLTKTVPKGTIIKFKAKDASDDGYTYPWIKSGSSEVKVYYNGDAPPSNPRSNQYATSAAEYMAPYIKNGKLALGENDFIYAVEITHTSDQIDSKGYDLQDAIVHVRVTQVTKEVNN